MSDILQCKALSNKIEEALKEKVIGDVHVEYTFDPSAFGYSIIVSIDDPVKNHSVYFKDPRWHYRVTLDEYIINCSIYGEDVTEKWVTATQNASAL